MDRTGTNWTCAAQRLDRQSKSEQVLGAKQSPSRASCDVSSVQWLRLRGCQSLLASISLRPLTPLTSLLISPLSARLNGVPHSRRLPKDVHYPRSDASDILFFFLFSLANSIVTFLQQAAASSRRVQMASWLGPHLSRSLSLRENWSIFSAGSRSQTQ